MFTTHVGILSVRIPRFAHSSCQAKFRKKNSRVAFLFFYDTSNLTTAVINSGALTQLFNVNIKQIIGIIVCEQTLSTLTRLLI